AETTFVFREQIYPTNEVAVVIRIDNSYELAQMKWGWERSFSKRPLINTRSAEAWNKKTWSEAMRNKRCIIPASGFFEWDQNQSRGKRDRYRISPTGDGSFAFGGLYEINSDGEMFMSILTTAPNKKMQKIHHRMPVILEQDEFKSWLDSDDRMEIEHMIQAAKDENIDVKLDS
ncbi:MAG: SOS response-associated peptidase family protein, partial [Gammaproteobacteria bacterium]